MLGLLRGVPCMVYAWQWRPGASVLARPSLRGPVVCPGATDPGMGWFWPRWEALPQTVSFSLRAAALWPHLSPGEPCHAPGEQQGFQDMGGPPASNSPGLW